jgi:hypothetical protein
MEANAVKGIKRTAEKLADGRTPTDVLRTTLTAPEPTPEMVQGVAQRFEQAGYRQLSIEDRWANRAEPGGYGDFTLKLEREGLVSEVLVMPEWMLRAKQKGGHALYRRWARTSVPRWQQRRDRR